MGQVLGFAHCKEAPSTASTTPDSTEGGNEDSDFPELPAPEPPEEEDDDDDDEDEDEDEAGAAAAAAAAARGPPRDPPRELTFSYIAFLGGAPRPRRDPRRGRAPRLSSGGSPRGPDPRAAPRAPPRRAPGPPEGSAEPGGALPGAGGARVEETPKRLAPAPLPAPPPGGAPRPPLPEPPPASAPPPPPADQSASAAGADGQVWALLCWRVPERSALSLLVALVALGSLSRFSAVSVGAYGALAVLAVTVPLRLRQVALRALGHAPAPPPERPEVAVLSPEQQQRWARCLARHVVTATRTLTRLFLVHSVPESLKFAFLFYLLTYVGAVCNGLTLLAAGVVCAFTFPVLYRRHQAQIEQYLGLLRSHLSHLRARVLAKLPSAKVKPQ
ncbi:reticulon-2 isoform X2 [Chamaea fasciata]|uniref:reticulon-2 isoform X2 n=1 Tax=Chamaea fasciata TaxID=190680 RepID=UPI00336A3D1C